MLIEFFLDGWMFKLFQNYVFYDLMIDLFQTIISLHHYIYYIIRQLDFQEIKILINIVAAANHGRLCKSHS